MRLDGAVGPHHGAPPTTGSSPSKKYRDKQRCQFPPHHPQLDVAVCNNLGSISNSSNNNNNKSNIKVNVSSSAPLQPLHREQQLQSNITTQQENETPKVNSVNSHYQKYTAKNSNNSREINEIYCSRSNSVTNQTNRCAIFKTQSNAVAAATSTMAANNVGRSVMLSIGMLTAKIMMRVQQSLMAMLAFAMCFASPSQSKRQSTSSRAATAAGATLRFPALCRWMYLLYAVALLPCIVRCDENDNFFAVNSFSMGPETTTPEFDYASRGQKKFGDKCDGTLECGFPGSICDTKKKSCQCTEDLPVTNHIDKCGKEAAVNESCFFNEQCEMKYFQTECRDGRCVCRFEMSPIWGKDGSVECKGRQDKRGPETYIDPAMIGVLVGMALMFIIICVVLRLFSQARWRENRTIFNTPNPRLMNVSLLRDSKLLHGQERRGSRMSVRAPSRQPSMASLRPHSPNPSLGKTGSGSHGSGSNASATSLRSTRSNSVAPGNVVNSSHHERKGSAHQSQHHHQQQPQQQQQQHHHQHQHHQQQQQPLMPNITANPAAESVTVEIIEPEK